MEYLFERFFTSEYLIVYLFLVIFFMILGKTIGKRWPYIVISFLFALLSLFSLIVSIKIITGCGVPGGCEMAGLIIYASLPVFLLTTALSYFAFKPSRKRFLIGVLFVFIVVALLYISDLFF